MRQQETDTRQQYVVRVSYQLVPALTSVLMALFMVGCGSQGPAGKVSGKVTLDGAPVPAGSNVVFVNQKTAQTAFGVVQNDGTYFLRTIDGEGAWVGTYDVAVTPAENKISDEQAMEMSMRGETPDFSSVIPEKYHSPTTSELTFSVEEGENTFDIQLEE